jgi:integrase
MPKLSNRPPKYAKLKNYAVVYLHGKIHYLGHYGSPESKTAYARLIAESRHSTSYLSKDEAGISIGELTALFLDHAKATLAPANYTHHRIALGDFLLKLYGDTFAENFKPSALKLVREEMIKSQRFCRKQINDYISRIVRLFSWGVEEEWVKFETAAVLKAVKPLSAGYPGTFDNPEREDVPDSVIQATLPFMPPVLRAMIQIQRLTGCRPSEIFNMRVGEIDRNSDSELWLYHRPHHKTEQKTKRKKVIPLGKPEQALILPYLEGKKPEEAVFSPQTAMEERNTEKRVNRQSKLTPSQIARAKAVKPRQYKEFYNKDSYRQAVEYAINKGNKTLPDGQKIPYWTPYQIRHTSATAMELAEGLDASQALLDHNSADMTKRYAHGRLEKLKELARNRKNPFARAEKER